MILFNEDSIHMELQILNLEGWMETGDSAIGQGKHRTVDFMVDVLGSLYGVSGMFTVGQNNLTTRARMSSVIKLHHTNFEILRREGWKETGVQQNLHIHCDRTRHGDFGSASDMLPVLEQGGMIINFCETETSDTSGQYKHQAHQDGRSGATNHELTVPEPRRMETDLCGTEASDVRYQVQDGSSEAASREMLLAEQGETCVKQNHI
jgi:hypothetical protein